MSDLAAGDARLPPENGRQLGAIAAAARTVSGTLDEIVWMVNPRNDTLERLVGYLAESAGEFLAATEIGLTLDLPEQVPAYAVPSAVRHHLVLVVREALNNVVKHAGARTVRLVISIGNEALTVVIADDGCGFNSNTIALSSNGLINSRQRLASVDGSYQIESRPGGGTHVTLTLPLPRLP
jgi:signal transduction histidine kinase